MSHCVASQFPTLGAFFGNVVTLIVSMVLMVVSLVGTMFMKKVVPWNYCLLFGFVHSIYYHTL